VAGFALASLLFPALAGAFCGFYVAGADTQLYNNATMVVMMREGTRTVLSMQNNYQGPPKDFALVVPVPVVLSEDNVKTLPHDIFERVDKLAAPRLVEYWEQDPCAPRVDRDDDTFAGRSGSIGSGSGYGAGAGAPVVVEARFAVGEYDIVILGARDALALESWLTGNGYKVPAGAARYLRPYVERGEKFFVAKVDVEKVTYKDGMATLSPLRVHYDSAEFVLPIRLGLMNARDAQDLIVHILAPQQRYQVANYKNVTIPTNLIVDGAARERFAEFYAALFDATLEKNPGAVVTEYAWDSGTCDPCPDTPLDASELSALGLDVLRGDGQRPPLRSMLQLERPVVSGPMDRGVVHRYLRRGMGRFHACHEQLLRQGQQGIDKGMARVSFTLTPAGQADKIQVTGLGKDAASTALSECFEQVVTRLRFPAGKAGGINKVRFDIRLHTGLGMRQGGGFVLTRLHARYDEKSLGEDLVFEVAEPIRGGDGGAEPREKAAVAAPANTFQGRYIIRHEWTGPMGLGCNTPRRGVWGGPHHSAAGAAGAAGVATARVARDLAFAPRGQIKLASLLREPVPALETAPATPAAPAVPATPAKPAKPGASKGCAAGHPVGDSAGLAILLLLWLAWRPSQRPEIRRAR
jgi:hypothetical protein